MEMPEGSNLILGQSHFIKTVEDIYEAMATSTPTVRFGLAFCESSGDRLVRAEGNDEELKGAAAENALRLGCGHSFVVLMREAYPINVLNQLKAVPEVCTIHAATANPLEVVVAETEQGRGVLGVIDGQRPLGVEDEDGVRWRKDILRRFGYKT
ncbi:adenosine monophosphate-protein transferase [miscellaneous Crenarchaeota group-15 archaeon DG-45]|uniref:Adenosine monophosphate-protein transferase n=1 Tax=miscellaneous Crenarchaeota group-15 archaeon DG-45 TaxID=1685127 RepID=A0A0M0BQG0_9ARCH|nr:MAG: adenosine monophosphate-protein transferase [miscellaneous Crenarchaeota group-15 archaeon DG-45]